MSTIDSDQQPTASADRTKGRVKWFNNKAGYGFLTVENGDDVEDVFVHHSALRTSEEQYKYAVEGEYVEFVMSPADSENHKWQASDVTGLDGGPLLCETRNARRQRDDGDVDAAGHGGGGGRRGPARGRGQRHGRPRGYNGPMSFSDEADGNYEWTFVRRRRRAGGRDNRGSYNAHQDGEQEQELEY